MKMNILKTPMRSSIHDSEIVVDYFHESYFIIKIVERHIALGGYSGAFMDSGKH